MTLKAIGTIVERPFYHWSGIQSGFIVDEVDVIKYRVSKYVSIGMKSASVLEPIEESTRPLTEIEHKCLEEYLPMIMRNWMNEEEFEMLVDEANIYGRIVSRQEVLKRAGVL
jgi:hypothetical protein